MVLPVMCPTLHTASQSQFCLCLKDCQRRFLSLSIKTWTLQALGMEMTCFTVYLLSGLSLHATLHILIVSVKGMSRPTSLQCKCMQQNLQCTVHTQCRKTNNRNCPKGDCEQDLPVACMFQVLDTTKHCYHTIMMLRHML